MTHFEHGPVQEPPLLPGAGELSDEPETIWKGRCVLDQASREIVEQSPVMCIEDGKLKLDLDAISAHEHGSAVRTLLEKFKESLVKKNTPVTHSTETVPLKQGKIQKVGQIFVRHTDAGSALDSTPWKLSTKRPIDQGAETATEATPHTSPSSSNGNESNEESPSQYARRIEVIRVPSGVCAGDRLGVFDSTAPPTTFIDIPSDAYPDMRLDFERPATPVKYLLLDGKGYKVGGNFMKQHAVRLTTHRGICKRLRCSVMGCHGDKSSMLFKRLGQGKEAAEYHRHWSSTSRESLRSRGLHFRMLASRVNA